MCIYSYADQISQGESRGFPQTFIPHEKFRPLWGCFFLYKKKKEVFVDTVLKKKSVNLINEFRMSDLL